MYLRGFTIISKHTVGLKGWCRFAKNAWFAEGAAAAAGVGERFGGAEQSAGARRRGDGGRHLR